MDGIDGIYCFNGIVLDIYSPYLMKEFHITTKPLIFVVLSEVDQE